MGRRSRISQLAPAVRAEVDRLIRDGATIDGIVAHLRAFGVELPRSTVGDYRKKASEQLARYREAQEVAGAWVAELGAQRDSQTGQLLAEMLKTLAFRTLGELGAASAEATDPMGLMLLARALKDVSAAEKTNIEIRKKVRAEFEAETAERAGAAADAAEAVGRGAGLSDDAAARIREIILGVVAA
jgi:hypothetical protein